MKEDGRLIPIGSGYLVQVSQTQSAGRQRFSIAHEICHTFFENEAGQRASGHVDEYTGLFDEERWEEYLCDVGAAQMLLHPNWLVIFRGEALSLDSIGEIQAACESSFEAAGRQLVDREPMQYSFILWEMGYRKGEEALRSQPVFAGMDAGPKARLRASRVYGSPTAPFFPRRKSVSEGSSIFRALIEQTRTQGVEQFDISGRSLVCECESEFSPFRLKGEMQARVMTVAHWTV